VTISIIVPAIIVLCVFLYFWLKRRRAQASEAWADDKTTWQISKPQAKSESDYDQYEPASAKSATFQRDNETYGAPTIIDDGASERPRDDGTSERFPQYPTTVARTAIGADTFVSVQPTEFFQTEAGVAAFPQARRSPASEFFAETPVRVQESRPSYAGFTRSRMESASRTASQTASSVYTRRS
jgi:hypothetical protein